MDWAFAALFAVTTLSDMAINDCPTGCLQQGETDAYFSLSAGQGYFQEDEFGEEIYLRYEAPKEFGPFQLAFGASATNDGALWAGAGAVHAKTFADDRLYFRLEALAGIYDEGTDGPDLGSPIEFRTGAEIGAQFKSGLRIGVSADHRSNAEISSTNPGYETIQLRISFPL